MQKLSSIGVGFALLFDIFAMSLAIKEELRRPRELHEQAAIFTDRYGAAFNDLVALRVRSPPERISRRHQERRATF